MGNPWIYSGSPSWSFFFLVENLFENMIVFKNHLLVHVRKTLPSVQDDVFYNSRKDRSVLNELTRAFLDWSHCYKKPNVGYFCDPLSSDVWDITDDETIQWVILIYKHLTSKMMAKNPTEVRLVEENSAVLQLSFGGETWYEAYELYANHFDMHTFGQADTEFGNTVKLVLKSLKLPFEISAWTIWVKVSILMR